MRCQPRCDVTYIRTVVVVVGIEYYYVRYYHYSLFLSIITLPHESSHKEVSLQWKLASSWVMPSPGDGPQQL